LAGSIRGLWTTEKSFHLVGSVKPEEGINTFESVGNNRLAFESTFSGDDREKLLKDAVKRENLLYLCTLSDQRGEHRDRLKKWGGVSLHG